MRNPLRRSCPPEVLSGLEELRPLARTRHAHDSLTDMQLYALVGRDRRKLTMEWVEQAREDIERCNRWVP